MKGGLILAFAIAACDAQGKSEDAHLVIPLAAESSRDQTRPGRTNSPTPATTTSAPPAEAPAKQEVENVPRARLVEMLVARDVLELTPEEAAARFEPVLPMGRESVIPEGFLLVGRTATEELSFDYSADGKGGFVCVLATLEMLAKSADASAVIRDEVEQQLRAKLGKPKTYPAAPSTPYWKLVRRTLVSLDEFDVSNRAGTPRAVAVRISEPGGP